jgi:hypothetical protein
VHLSGLGADGRGVDVGLSDAFVGSPPYADYVSYGDTEVVEGEERYELWPMLIEKAWAKYRGGYDKAEDFYETTAFSFISDAPFSNVEAHKLSPEQIVKMFEDAERAGNPVAVMAEDPRTFPELREGFYRAKVTGYHAYAFMGMQDGKIVLYNPWGRRHPEPLTGEQFKELFSTITVGKF